MNESLKYALDKLKFLSENPSDINMHLETMYEYATECDHITEMGVRKVVSTWAFVAATPKKIVCYDIVPCPVDEAASISKDLNIDFNFIVGDTIDPNLKIEKTDLLFIDTWHVYEQLKLELQYHSDSVNKYIILHDTTTFGDFGEEQQNHLYTYTNHLDKNIQKTGLWPAVEEFLELNKNWQLKKRYFHNNGLTILERVS